MFSSVVLIVSELQLFLWETDSPMPSQNDTQLLSVFCSDQTAQRLYRRSHPWETLINWQHLLPCTEETKATWQPSWRACNPLMQPCGVSAHLLSPSLRFPVELSWGSCLCCWHHSFPPCICCLVPVLFPTQRGRAPSVPQEVTAICSHSRVRTLFSNLIVHVICSTAGFHARSLLLIQQKIKVNKSCSQLTD